MFTIFAVCILLALCFSVAWFHTRGASPAIATVTWLLYPLYEVWYQSTAPAHRHSGPEAWYTLSGETCLETPEGKMIGRAGGSHVIVPGGPPMHLTATGTETRRALVLILHDSAQPPTTMAPDWTPKSLCRD